MRVFVSLLLVFTFLLSFSQRSPLAPNIRKLKNDTVIWKPDSLLRPEDFKARPKSNGPLGLSYVGFLYYTNEASGELILNVEAIFVKSKSYIVKNTEYVLKHEQIHFDIAELHARRLRKRIDEVDFKKIKSVQNEINKLHDKTVKEYGKEQEEYDKDTEHGLNAAKQKVWNEKIQAAIKELDKYSSHTVDITN